MQFYILVHVLLAIMANADTVHFTNSPSHLVGANNFTTYELQVPGSNPITIVEAESGDDGDITEGMPQGKNSNEERSSHQSEDDYHTISVASKKMVYAPSLLDKFLNEYSNKVHDSVGEGNRNQVYKDKPFITRVYESSTNKHHRPASQNPFNDKEGWVTLQAVPWSRSQVSKWKPNSEVKPQATISSLNIYKKGYSTTSSVKGPSSQWDNEDVKSFSYPKKRPNFYHQLEDDYSENDSGSQRPQFDVPWSTSKSPSTQQHSHNNDQIESAGSNDRWYDYGFRPNFDEPKKPWEDDILVSDYNSNAVHTPIKNPRPYEIQPQYYANSVSALKHPSTHPSNGNGEWILISSTKGYQHGRRVQRGMNNSEPQQPSNTTFRRHKSVKLTVLPAKSNGDKSPMATSHGGLLEVDSSDQSVEASFAATNKVKKTKSKAGKKTGVVQAFPIDTHAGDSSAVLAAVGAGMVPATVAMLMPVVLGRKRRALEYKKRFEDATRNVINRL